MGRRSGLYLRVSVTARCNLACVYCRPSGDQGAAPDDLLSAATIVDFVRHAVACGVNRVRVTGGEPLVRRDIVAIVEGLARVPGLDDLGLTTNGTRLADLAAALFRAGLRRVNVGISSVRPDVYQRITRGGRLADALAGLDAALDHGLDPVKVNAVIMRGINDDEIADLARLAEHRPIEVRFVEYMPFVDGPDGHDRLYVPAGEILDRVRTAGDLAAVGGTGHGGPARRYRVAGFAGTIGVITPHSEPFCATCNRIRLTADGKVRACLVDGGEQDAAGVLQNGLDRAAVAQLLDRALAMKPDLHSGRFCGKMYQIGG